MPRLILFRHAVAESARAGQSDHERALTKGGRKDSAAMGKVIAKRGETIDLVLCSTSKRTRETWDYAAPSIGQAPEVRFLRSIYDANDNYLSILNDEGGDAETLVVVGHNPAIQATAIDVAADLASRDGRKLASRFAKGGIVILDFDGEWRSLKPHRMRLMAYIEPERD
jgi:phosphohistidine phosphatase